MKMHTVTVLEMVDTLSHEIEVLKNAKDGEHYAMAIDLNQRLADNYGIGEDNRYKVQVGAMDALPDVLRGRTSTDLRVEIDNDPEYGATITLALNLS